MRLMPLPVFLAASLLVAGGCVMTSKPEVSTVASPTLISEGGSRSGIGSGPSTAKKALTSRGKVATAEVGRLSSEKLKDEVEDRLEVLNSNGLGELSEAEDSDALICRAQVCGDFGAGVAIAWPLIGRVSSKFGMRRGRLHAGIDVAAPKGTPIVAAAAGQVLAAKRWSTYGNVVIIGHRGNRQTLYAHLLRAAVKTGQIVEMGEVIGYVGRSGRASGYHLHFETRIDGYPVDPSHFLPSTETPVAPRISAR